MNGNPAASIHFPIEGRSQWVMILRALVFASVSTLVILAIVFSVTPNSLEGFGISTATLILLIGAFLAVEYQLFLKVIVPRVADYGRFRIYENKVSFFPLTGFGLSVARQPENETISKFEGVSVAERYTKHSGKFFAVELIHPRPARTLRVRHFPTAQEAQIFAQELAGQLQLNVIPAAAAKRRAL